MKGTGFFGVGSALLVLIFSVLCLTVSALMTLSSANSDKALAEKLETSVLSYYSADGNAVETAVLLQESISIGDIPSELGDIKITFEGNGMYSYSCAIDDKRAVCVRLQEENGSLKILSWLETYTKEWTPDEALQIWEGDGVP